MVCVLAGVVCGHERSLCALKSHFQRKMKHQSDDVKMVTPDGQKTQMDDDDQFVAQECRLEFEVWAKCVAEVKKMKAVAGEAVEDDSDDSDDEDSKSESSPLALQPLAILGNDDVDDDPLDYDAVCAQYRSSGIRCAETVDDVDEGCEHRWYDAFDCFFTVQCLEPVRCSKDIEPQLACANTCPFAANGVCETGGVCACGTDCQGENFIVSV